MPMVRMTFVQAAYVLATFVHISNISAVTDLILTKLPAITDWHPVFWKLLYDFLSYLKYRRDVILGERGHFKEVKRNFFGRTFPKMKHCLKNSAGAVCNSVMGMFFFVWGWGGPRWFSKKIPDLFRHKRVYMSDWNMMNKHIFWS